MNTITNHLLAMPADHTLYHYFVIQGALRLYTPSGIMDYLPGQYSISAIDTPLSNQVLQSPLNTLALSFQTKDVIDMILQLPMLFREMR